MRFTSIFHFTTTAVLLLGLVGCQESSESLLVRNTGNTLIQVSSVKQGDTVAPSLKGALGSNGTITVGSGNKLLVGDASVCCAEQIEISNTGTDLLTINYVGDDGAPRKMLLGQSGTGYFRGSTPVMLGDLMIARQSSD